MAMGMMGSVPASPTTPIDAETSRREALAALGERIENDMPTAKSSPITKSKIECPVITRHPLHTFIVPTLCQSCAAVRESNIARFTAQSVADSVERLLAAKADLLPNSPIVQIFESPEAGLKWSKTIKSCSTRIAPATPVKRRMSRWESGKQVQQLRILEGKENTMQPVVKTFDMIDTSSGDMSPLSKRTSQSGPGATHLDENSDTSSYTIFIAPPESNSSISADPRALPPIITSSSRPISMTNPAHHRKTSNLTFAALVDSPSQPLTIPVYPIIKSMDKRTDITRSDSSPRPASPRWQNMRQTWRQINDNVTVDVFGRNASGMDKIMGCKAAPSGSIEKLY
ncbi:hypothetical protein LTR66_017790 [Elasticomyces elasticus]|nr:hypothetical protein LTR66_017790 [Elasticomyces elasticus]